MAAQIILHLFDGFQFLADDQPVRGLTSPRIQSLLAYLVLHRNMPQSRQHLAFLFWTNATEEQARTNLRKAIHFLRRALPFPEILLSNDGSLQWNPEIPLSLDTAEFEAAVEAGEYERAVALYSGDLLPNCYDEWILLERERFKQVYVEVLERFLQQREEDGDYPAALSCARRLVQNDPLRERNHRLLMRIHAARGDRAAVLQAYRNCVTLLEQELGIEPSLITRQLYERLSKYLERGTNRRALTETLPLVGRSSELSLLLEIWQVAAQGNPKMVLITGEAGIGKTRLAEELRDWVTEKGIESTSACCYEMDDKPPYAPVRDWLYERPLPSLEPVWQAEVARLMPELINQYPDWQPIGSITESWQRRRFHEALARALLDPNLGTALPLLLIIDDLQWCDSDTLDFLNLLLRINSRARLLIVGTLRDDAIENAGPLSDLLVSLRQKNLLTEIRLDRLDRSETVMLGQQAAGNDLDVAASHSLYKETEGNPLFIIEYAQSVSKKPIDIPEAGRETVLPPRVQAIITARLRKLTPSARKIMEVAATIGRDFTYDVLAKASHEEEAALIQALEELWRKRVIREQGKDRYDFSHDKLRQVVYAALSPARRQWLHRRVAQAITELNTRHPEIVSWKIGWHYEQAGSDWLAAQWLQQAGEAVLKLGAFSDAIAYLTRALELTSAEDQARRYEILLSREKIYHLQAAREFQANDLAAMEELAKSMKDDDLDSAFRRAQVALERGVYLRETSDLPGALDMAQKALTLIHQTRERKNGKLLADRISKGGTTFTQLEFEAYYLWGTSLEYQGNYKLAIVQEEKALELARASGMHPEEARALSSLAYSNDNILVGKDYLLAALPVYRQVGDKPGESACLEKLGYTFLWTGDYDDALNCYKQSLQLSRQIGFRSGEVIALFRLGHFYNQVGDYLRGKGYLERALSMSYIDRDQRRVAYELFNISVSERCLGQMEGAKKHALEALAICREIGDKNGEINSWDILGSACVQLGQWDEAVAAFQQALNLVQSELDPSGAIYCQAKLAGALLRQGLAVQALGHIEDVLKYQENGGSLQGTDEGPVPVYLECYRVLQANCDLRTRKILEIAYSWIQDQAIRIKDKEIRRSFLENKSENRELMKAWLAYSLPFITQNL